jgi:hypothetical protein
MNLYDLRDVLSRAALIARYRAGPQALYARDLLEALDADGLENFWRFSRMTMHHGGRAFLEGTVASRADSARRSEHPGVRLHQVDPRDVERAAARHGGTVVHREDVPSTASAGSGAPARWRMIVEWPRP